MAEKVIRSNDELRQYGADKVREIANQRRESDAAYQRSKLKTKEEKARGAIDRMAKTFKEFAEKHGGSDSFEKHKAEAIRIAERAERRDSEK